MIIIKNETQIEGIRKSCHELAKLLDILESGFIKEGMSTKEIDDFCYDYITNLGGKPAFLNYGGFPASACISVNDVVIHGIPSKDEIVKNGDLVSVDLGINLDGYFSDSARTFIVGGKSTPENEKLCQVTKECLELGIKAAAKKNARISDIGRAVYSHATKNGFGVVKDYCGHGVGLDLHESPEIPNYVSHISPNPRLRAGMVIAIEPMINLGTDRIRDNYEDGWTVRTADKKPSAHFEHTVLIKNDGIEILTKV
ncbi:MAG: type I methionyl aminopeptidase [Pleomorphochaeta sp.]